MTRQKARVVVLTLGIFVLLFAVAAPAAATIRAHLGDCTANGQFNPGGFRDAASAKVVIPQEATVAWAGTVVRQQPDDPRTVTGEVRLELPLGQQVTLGDWNTTGRMVSNNGTFDYEVPSVLAGFEMTFSGEHFEPEGLWCSGEVTIEVQGSNPLGLAAIGLTVISVVGVSLAIIARPGSGVDVTEYRRGDVI